MIEHHVIIAKMLKERLEAKNQNNQEQEAVETIKIEDIKEEDFSFKTANESKFDNSNENKFNSENESRFSSENESKFKFIDDEKIY